MSDLVAVTSIRPEAEIVADLKERAARCLLELGQVMDDAARAGFALRWAAINFNSYTFRHEVVDLHLEKRY
jgi:hypothetical protein